MGSGFTPEDRREHAGERIVFAAWATVLVAGLALMIVIPLSELLS